MHGCLVGILALLALPVGLPLVIAALAIIFALFIVGFSIVVAFSATGIGLLVGAIGAVIAGVCFLFTLPVTGLTFLGMSLFMAGVSILLILAAVKFCQFIFWLIGRIFNKTLGKKDGEVQ